MRKKLAIVLSYILSIALGYATAIVLPLVSPPKIRTEWLQIPPQTGNGSTTFSFEAFSNSDIDLPKVKQIVAEAKFVDHGTENLSLIRLGYKVNVDVNSLDLAKVPEKYKKEKTVDIGDGRKMTELPIEQVTYAVEFEFTLKDKDGFNLGEVKSERQSIQSGKANFFQGLATEVVSLGIASKTATVAIRMNVVKCLTCG